LITHNDLKELARCNDVLRTTLQSYFWIKHTNNRLFYVIQFNIRPSLLHPITHHFIFWWFWISSTAVPIDFHSPIIERSYPWKIV